MLAFKHQTETVAHGHMKGYVQFTLLADKHKHSYQTGKQMWLSSVSNQILKSELTTRLKYLSKTSTKL